MTTYRIQDSNGRDTNITATTEQGAIDAFAAGRPCNVVREGSLVTVYVTGETGQVIKAYVTDDAPLAAYVPAEPPASARQIDYIRSLARKSAAYGAVPADLSALTVKQASRLIATLQNTYYA